MRQKRRTQKACSDLLNAKSRSLDEATRPFAYATFVAALAISSVNFEVKTDSWWGAMLAGIWLLIALGARDRGLAMPMTRS